jgi:hypothetical protein
VCAFAAGRQFVGVLAPRFSHQEISQTAVLNSSVQYEKFSPSVYDITGGAGNTAMAFRGFVGKSSR